MSKEHLFACWAPETSPWSPWAKPVLFAYLDTPGMEVFGQGEELPSTDWVRSISPGTAIVVDLPGAESVRMGLALANSGFRPVPLFNAVPAPSTGILTDPENYKRWVAVDVRPIIGTLRRGAGELAALNMPGDAPPVFLLDAGRGAGGRDVGPEEFDNRSLCFTTDFPSANFLAAHGIRRALLVQKSLADPSPDLRHPLRRWQEGGLALERISLDALRPPEPFEVPRPSWFGMMFQRALAGLGFRRARGGGFGGWLPDHGGGG